MAGPCRREPIALCRIFSTAHGVDLKSRRITLARHDNAFRSFRRAIRAMVYALSAGAIARFRTPRPAKAEADGTTASAFPFKPYRQDFAPGRTIVRFGTTGSILARQIEGEQAVSLSPRAGRHYRQTGAPRIRPAWRPRRNQLTAWLFPMVVIAAKIGNRTKEKEVQLHTNPRCGRHGRRTRRRGEYGFPPTGRGEFQNNHRPQRRATTTFSGRCKPGLPAHRVRKECNPIDFVQELRQDCMASFDPVDVGLRPVIGLPPI